MFTGWVIQSLPVSEGANTFFLILGPLANVNNLPAQYAGCYFVVFLTEFAKYALAVQFIYRWLVICR
jgi:hypothetical protein